MCTCGCTQYVPQGKKAVLDRAAQIVHELEITPENAADYEDTEIICRLIAPFAPKDGVVFETAAWVATLHSAPRKGREDRYQAHARAFHDIFNRLPARGTPRDITTAWHQLEKLEETLDDQALAAVEPTVRAAIEAMRNVRGGYQDKAARLKERYGL
ncbi:MAG: hypothetical protein HY673_10680 [Chloroflexi bacterium]|nr:hypothetical protein [Chloroflexota bacterium]